MATIKLGSLTLGNVALGSSTIGDTRKLGKSKILRSESLKNHTIDKTVINAIRAYELVRDNIPGAGGGVSPTPQPEGGEGSTWLLANGTWNDNGVWDDTQNWND